MKCEVTFTNIRKRLYPRTTQLGAHVIELAQPARSAEKELTIRAGVSADNYERGNIRGQKLESSAQLLNDILHGVDGQRRVVSIIFGHITGKVNGHLDIPKHMAKPGKNPSTHCSSFDLTSCGRIGDGGRMGAVVARSIRALERLDWP
jgi:hypothetical protein